MSTVIAEYARRPKRAADADGLNDVVGGIGFLSISFLWYANSLLTATMRGHNFHETPAYRQGVLFLVLTVIGMYAALFLSKWYVKTLRERFVYPRLGYVAHRIAPIVRQKLIVLVVALAVTLLMPIVFRTVFKTSGPWPSGLLVLLSGGFSSLVYLWYFAKFGFVRHLIIAAVSVVAALILAALSVDELLAVRYFTLISGATIIAGGVVTFRRLLRTAIVTEDEME